MMNGMDSPMVLSARFTLWVLLAVNMCLFHSLGASAVSLNMDCNRRMPQHGRWIDAPPYWLPDNCKTRLFDSNETIRCMTGRTLYVMGNSIGRQQAFALLELVGGTAFNREGQRDACPKHETFWGDSCHNEYNNVKFKYLFMQFLDGYNYSDRGGFPFVDRNKWPTKLPDTPGQDHAMYWEDDNCISKPTRGCLANFFSGATERDIFMFVGGMSYCGVGSSDPHPSLNTAWLRSSASAFRSHITAVFPGSVFWLTNAHVLRKYESSQPCVDETNQLLSELWTVHSDDPRKAWYTIDQAAINRGRSHLYNDALHFVGPLTMASLQQMLNEVCPASTGLSMELLSWTGRIVQRNESSVAEGTKSTGKHGRGRSMSSLRREGDASEFSSPSSPNTHRRRLTDHTRLYLVADNGQLQLLPQNCRDLLTNQPIVTLSADVFDRAVLGTALATDFCAEGKLYQPTNSRSVYVVYRDHLLHEFKSAGAFSSRGFRFEDVQRIEPALFDLFVLGSPWD